MSPKNTEVIYDLISNRITFETKSGSVGITTNRDGQLIIGALSAPGTANTLIIDPINNKIQTSEIRFSDGTYIDTAPTFNGTSGASLFNLKANKLFFKYNSNGDSISGQIIELKIQKSSDILSGISFSFSPNPTNNITLTQIDSLTWSLSLSEFEKANSDTLSITATCGNFSDTVSVFKASDGLDAIAGGLTNPFVSIPVESDGTINSTLLSEYLTSAGGQFVVFKGGQELTGNPSLVTYSVASSTQGLSVNIGSNGIYTVSSFDVAEEDGQAILMATDNATGQKFKTKFSILTVKKGQNGADGATGPAGPTGASGPAGSAGLNAKTVKISVDDAQIAYSASNLYPSPTEIQITASQQNHAGTVYYEFAVYEGAASSGISLVNSTSDTLLLTNTNKNYGLVNYKFINDTKTEYGKSKTLKVVTREGSPTSTPISEDSVTIIATKDGSDSLDVVFPNNNHTFPADSDGTVESQSYSGGGSIVEAYIGNEQLTPTLSTLSNGKFKVTVSSNSNIVPGTITTDVINKRIVLGDPSAMSSSNTAEISYLIEGTDSKGLSKSSLVKASFTKSKKGDAGTNGVDGLSGILTNESHTIAASSSGEIFDFASSPLANAGGTFNIYRGGTSINSLCTFSIVNGTTSKIQNGLTASINPTTGLYSLSTLNSISWTSNSEIFTFRAVSGSSSIEKTYTLVKSLGGANAKIIVLKSTAQTFKKDTNGSYSPSVQIVEFTSSLKNITATPSWTVDNSSAGVSTNGGISTKLNISSDGLKASMSASQFDAARNASGDSFATIKVSALENSITYDDAITVQLVQDGAQGVQGATGATGATGASGTDASSGLLTNESHTIAASSSGEIFNYSANSFNTAGGTFKFYKGNSLLASGVVYSIFNGTTTVSSLIQNGLTASINNSSGVYTLTAANSTGWTTNAESFTFRAVSGSTTIDKIYTIAKSLGGANAKILTLTSNAQTFKKNTSGSYSPNPQTINFTANLQNLSGNPTWTINGSSAGSNLSTTSNTATMTNTQFDNARGINNSVTIKASITDSAITYYDEITINLLQDGAAGADGANGTNGADGVDTALIYDFNQTIQYDAATLVPYGWNITPSSSVDLTTANAASSVLAPKFEPSGGYNYPYLSGSGYTGRHGGSNLPIGLTVIASADSIYGGKLGQLCIQSFTSSLGTNQTYIYTSEAIPISQNNTYELSYRIKQNTNFILSNVGLFFFDVNGILITSIDTSTSTTTYAQTTFPAVDSTVSIDQAWQPTITSYYSFESGGSLKTFPSNAKYVKPYVRLKFFNSTTNSATNIRQLLIDYLYFGEKTTPNTRNGLFVDNITGRITVGAALADVAGSSGGLVASKYDANANFEIITGSDAGPEIVDLRLTRAYPSGYINSASNGQYLAKGVDIAAIRFAGWNGLFQTANNTSSNMIIDERAEIRATYMRTGSNQVNFGAVGGASLDFYTAPSRATTGSISGFSTATVPLLRARITDQGQFLVGYNDSATEINPNITVFIGDYPSNSSTYTFNTANSNPKLAINGNIYGEGSLIITNNNANNLIEGKSYIQEIEPVDAFGYIGKNTPFDQIHAENFIISNTNRTGNTTTTYIKNGEIKLQGTNANFNYAASTGQAQIVNGYLNIDQRILNSTADNGNASTNGALIINHESGSQFWRLFVNNGFDLSFTYNAAIKGYILNTSTSNALNFTGQHRNIPNNNDDYTNKIGLIVVSSGQYASINSNSITINEALPRVQLSNKRNEKNVFGVISDKEDENKDTREYAVGNFVSVEQKLTGDNRLIINSLGEGGIWVCNINGNLENGDYITTCEIPGYGMKQDDDLLHNYTVAKITCDCDFDLNSPIYICEEFEFESKIYRRAFVGCTYHCG